MTRLSSQGGGSGGSGITELTGDGTAGPGSGSQALTLANSGVTPGSYTNANVTFDAKGRATAASSGTGGVGGAGSILLGTFPASNSASLDIVSIISATYDEYLLELNDLTVGTNGTTGLLLFSTNNGSTWAATTYNYNIVAYPSGSTVGTVNNNAAGASFLIGGSYTGAAFNTNSAYAWSASIRLRGLNSASLWKRIYGHGVYAGNNSNATSISEWVGGAWETTTAVNAVQVKPSSGNFVSGNVRIYGVSK